MRAVIVMFDSLNRHMLSCYGCKETLTPNFERLARHAVQFDTCYAGSLPCMPARRELHTGRYNFLHRSWGPIEPYDDSMPALLGQNGVHTHLVSDHHHYWQDGGATYHTRYTTWECVRGQEGDPWKGVVRPITEEEKSLAQRPQGVLHRHQDRINRPYIAEEARHPQTLTFDAGLEFIDTNHAADQWLVQIEAFDPHEPFFAPERYHQLYPEPDYGGADLDWPAYCPVREGADTVAHVRRRYAALLSMCDRNLGRVLDAFDRYGLWRDTLLVICTDHGFLLGEHGLWAKGYMPPYEELVHTPLFIWDPRCGQKNVRRRALVQTIDIPATVLSCFGVPLPPDMMGRDLLPVMAEDTPVRDGALLGWYGRHVCYTDGRWFYMQAPCPGNTPLYEYTLMPTHMDYFFDAKELATMERHAGFSFTKGMQLMRTRSFLADMTQSPLAGGTMLFDLQNDPRQEHPLDDPDRARQCRAEMSRLMRAHDAPREQWERLGLEKEE